jgi:hypothetical protein
MKQDLKSRIQRMFMQDCVMAWFDVLLLWAVAAFVLYDTLEFIEDSNIRLALYVSCAILVLFNTASVAAMTSHYAEDKDFIYGLDIKHLDANREEAARISLATAQGRA